MKEGVVAAVVLGRWPRWVEPEVAATGTAPPGSEQTTAARWAQNLMVGVAGVVADLVAAAAAVRPQEPQEEHESRRAR